MGDGYRWNEFDRSCESKNERKTGAVAHAACRTRKCSKRCDAYLTLTIHYRDAFAGNTASLYRVSGDGFGRYSCLLRSRSSLTTTLSTSPRSDCSQQ